MTGPRIPLIEPWPDHDAVAWIKSGFGPRGVIMYTLQIPYLISADVHRVRGKRGWFWRTPRLYESDGPYPTAAAAMIACEHAIVKSLRQALRVLRPRKAA